MLADVTKRAFKFRVHHHSRPAVAAPVVKPEPPAKPAKGAKKPKP